MTPATARAAPSGAPWFGPRVLEGRTAFRLWAPEASGVELILDDHALPMEPAGDGFFAVEAPGVGPGAAYAFRIGGHVVPDPASRRQAGDVASPSVVVDPAVFGGNRRLGRPWREAVIVEVHVGAATPGGTFRALIDALDGFVEAGFTLVQLMPVNAFPGRFNWGYDGVLPFAPAPAYGTPEDLVALVAAAHARGLMIALDVVYNHFGPAGNFLPLYARDFFDPYRRTPWGAAVDTRREAVRRYFVENALMWLEDYGFDALRFDAVHAYHPEGRPLFLSDLAAATAPLRPRPILVAENEENDADILARDGDDGFGPFRAQWNDDFHNALHVVLTREREGYYAAYADAPHARLARALAEGFCYQGEPNPLRGGEPRGRPSTHLPPTAFVAFAQNHDQVGNRPVGDRLVEILDPDRLAFARLLTIMVPQIPLLFMGEDYASRRRFPFFVDFDGALADAVREGRRREFRDFPGFADEIPDPVSPETFEIAKLDPIEPATPEARAARAATRALLDLRRAHVVPLLAGRFEGAAARVETCILAVRWTFSDGRLVLVGNAGDEARVYTPDPGIGPVPGAVPVAVTGSVDADGDELLIGRWAAAVWVTS